MKTHSFLSFIFGAAVLAIGFSSCTKDDPEPVPTPSPAPADGTVRLSSLSLWQNEALVENNVYTDSFNRPLRIETLEAYISEVYAINENDEEVLMLSVDRMNLLEGWSSDITLPRGNYKGLRFGIGVPSELNTDQDPAQYPNDHPLSVQGSQGMFWTWASGYIFIKFDGKVALDGDAENILDPYVFHIGMNNYYRNFELMHDFTVGAEVAELQLRFDADAFLSNADDTIDLENDNLTHTMDNMMLANRFIELFTEAVSLQ